jgi:hypothetical protein
MEKEPAIKTEADEKLHWLRRLDHEHDWKFLDEERYCLRCRKTFTGREARLTGGTRPHGPLRFRCPTSGCSSTPAEWVDPREAHELRHRTFSLARLFRSRPRAKVWPRPSPVHLAQWEERHPRLRTISTVLHYFGLTV